jgi:integrase
VVITAARTLPVIELRPGLKDVRRPAALMHACIALSLLARIRTEEARALRWQHVDLDGNPAASPPVPPHVAVWRSVRVHGETKTERSRRTLGLPAVAVQALRALRETQAEERLTAGDNWQDTGLVFTTHRGAALDVGHASTRTTEIVYRRELRPVITTGAEIMDQLFTGTQPPHQARIPPRTCTGQPPIPGYLWNSTSGPWPAKAPLKRPWKV